MTKSKNTVDIIEKHGTWRFKVRHGLLQIATGNTKCDDYYKLRQVLQSAMIITNCDST